MTVAVIDYGMGNIHSVQKKVKQHDVNAILSANANDILNADKLILPGVGHFGAAMKNLHRLGIYDALQEAVTVKKTPVLGICLGMQLMAKGSQEGDEKGLGWFDAEIVRFKVPNPFEHKVPHTGWNTIEIKQEAHPIMKGIPNQTAFYFVHAFHLVAHVESDILNTTNYAYEFTSAICKDNIIGVQYHPEKSHNIGQILFKNFIQL